MAQGYSRQIDAWWISMFVDVVRRTLWNRDYVLLILIKVGQWSSKIWYYALTEIHIQVSSNVASIIASLPELFIAGCRYVTVAFALVDNTTVVYFCSEIVPCFVQQVTGCPIFFTSGKVNHYLVLDCGFKCFNKIFLVRSGSCAHVCKVSLFSLSEVS